jgi:uroporphyrinogen decarboxylase
MLSPVDYQEFSWKYINQIVEALADDPVIVFGKDVGSLLAKWEKAALALVDWTCSPRNARYLLVETSLYRKF